MSSPSTASATVLGARAWHRSRDWSIIAIAVVGAAISGAATKRSGFGPAFAAVSPMPGTEVSAPESVAAPVEPVMAMIAASIEPELVPDVPAPPPKAEPALPAGVIGTVSAEPGHDRYFNGRPIRPVRTLTMTVTAYSPDARSCGEWADGITASLKSVWTNGMRLVAADTRILPMGTMISVPGYAGGEVVPVLDRGGAIKGHRLDVLYPTHEIALRWGVRKIPVTVWEYADGR